MLYLLSKMGGPLEYNEIKDANKDVNWVFNNFVETGTYKGDSCIMASEYFPYVYTFEIVSNLYNYSVNRAKELNIHNISFNLGDSLTLLPQLIPSLKGGSVYFIDAHQSGHDTSNNGIDVPLLEELDAILSHRIEPSLFIFDDMRFWKGQSQEAWDWVNISISSVDKKIEEKGYTIVKSFPSNDRYFVFVR